MIFNPVLPPATSTDPCPPSVHPNLIVHPATDTNSNITNTNPNITNTNPNITNTNPNITNTNPNITDTNPNITDTPGHAAKSATTIPSSVQQRHPPHHAAKSCQPPAIISNNVVQPTKRVNVGVNVASTPAQKPPKIVAPVGRICAPPDSMRGRSDHEYSSSAQKRPAPENKSPASPVRKTAKQQAEAISEFFRYLRSSFD